MPTTKVIRRVHKCGRCGGFEHHKNACKEPLGKSRQSKEQQR